MKQNGFFSLIQWIQKCIPLWFMPWWIQHQRIHTASFWVFSFWKEVRKNWFLIHTSTAVTSVEDQVLWDKHNLMWWTQRLLESALGPRTPASNTGLLLHSQSVGMPQTAKLSFQNGRIAPCREFQEAQVSVPAAEMQ